MKVHTFASGKTRGLIALLTLFVLGGAWWAVAYAGGSDEAAATADQGLITDEQADRGLQAYRQRGCADCHGGSFEGAFGPPLNAGSFRAKWGGSPVSELVEFAYSQMPPGSGRSVPRATILDIVTAVLRANGAVTGASEELTVETLEGVTIAFPEQ